LPRRRRRRPQLSPHLNTVSSCQDPELACGIRAGADGSYLEISASPDSRWRSAAILSTSTRLKFFPRRKWQRRRRSLLYVSKITAGRIPRRFASTPPGDFAHYQCDRAGTCAVRHCAMPYGSRGKRFKVNRELGRSCVDHPLLKTSLLLQLRREASRSLRDAAQPLANAGAQWRAETIKCPESGGIARRRAAPEAWRRRWSPARAETRHRIRSSSRRARSEGAARPTSRLARQSTTRIPRYFGFQRLANDLLIICDGARKLYVHVLPTPTRGATSVL